MQPPEYPPYPPQQPPQPQQPYQAPPTYYVPPPTKWSRKTRILAIAGLVVAVVLLCSVVTGMLVNAANIYSQALSATPTDAAATVPFTPYSFTVTPSTPTPELPPEPTLAPVTSAAIFAPTLGGTIDNFQQKYGPDTDGNGMTYEATISGQKVEIMLTLDDATQSLDGQTHVVDVQVQAAAGEQWSSTLASTIAKTFLPSDAKYQKTTTTSGVRDYVYQSKGMKATFTADQFTNGFGDVTVAAGTANYSCQRLPPATSGYELCDISIGVY